MQIENAVYKYHHRYHYQTGRRQAHVKARGLQKIKEAFRRSRHRWRMRHWVCYAQEAADVDWLATAIIV